MNLDQYPVPPGYTLITDKPSWKALPPYSIMLTPMGWVMPLTNPIMHTPDGPVAVLTAGPDILEEAFDLTSKDRQEDYGSAQQSFSRIANFWNAYLNHKLIQPIFPVEVAQMMTLLKISRSVTSHKRDTFVDQAGYTRLAYLLTESPQTPDPLPDSDQAQ